MMGTESAGPSTLADVVAWCRQAPAGTRLDAHAVADMLASVDMDALHVVEPVTAPETWRERLWTCPEETRLGVREVAEALGRPRSFVYARTGPRSTDPIPHRKIDGTIQFKADEIRHWLESREQVIPGGLRAL